MALRRLGKELREVQKSEKNGDTSSDDILLTLVSDENLYLWEAYLRGPPDTPFEGGTYVMRLHVPHEYPMLPPKATFVTRVFHPNVNFSTGAICLDILKTKWSPAWTLMSVCRAVWSLLAEPEANSPLNCDAGNLIRAGDMEGYKSMVRMYAIMDAGAPQFTEGA